MQQCEYVKFAQIKVDNSCMTRLQIYTFKAIFVKNSIFVYVDDKYKYKYKNNYKYKYKNNF